MTEETPMWIASFTKLMTTIAILQCIEKEKLSLDTDVTSILHELSDLKILTGFDESGEPTLKEKGAVITVWSVNYLMLFRASLNNQRHLLTHTSGLSYDLFHPLLQKWRIMKGEKVAGGPTVVERFLYPLVYEPGTSWEYSSALDWAGKLVERVNNNQTLTEYMEANIMIPLGITDVTFHIDLRADMQRRMADLSVRDAKREGILKYTENELVKGGAIDDMGGGGAFTSPANYLKIMQSLLANDGRLLESDTVDQMFEPQLDGDSQKALMEKLEVPAINAVYGALPPLARKNWAFAGMMNCDDIQERRRAGATTWIGLPNMNWVSLPF